mgnify:FL=1
MKSSLSVCSVVLILVSGFLLADDEKPNDPAKAKAKTASRRAFINGDGPGWKVLTLANFDNVNCAENTWQEKDGTIYCTGLPVGVTRSKKTYENFELVAEWRHMKPAGNSAVLT